ncbi:MAG: class I SAM-dependent methyltransferase [Elusimicrobia bacterium]|nr:class I SAM-dependent methyltransferase [Elusimicrobiota bacterium]
MGCLLCGGSRLKKIFLSKNSGIVKCPDCGFMSRYPYNGCVSAKCAACPDRCIDRLSDPAFLEARLRVDSKRAGRIKKLTGGDFSELKILELGTGLGCLASQLAGSAGQYLGTEPSSVFHGFQLENFKSLSGKVLNTLLPGAEYEEHFDLLIAVDILQFTDKPLDFMKEAKSFLKKGGLFYLEVPDESLLRLRAGARKFLGLYKGEPVHHGHINFFTESSLRCLIERSGLNIEKMSRLSIAGDEDRLFLTIKKELPFYLKAMSLCARLTKADLPLGLGNTVCLCSRRE